MWTWVITALGWAKAGFDAIGGAKAILVALVSIFATFNIADWIGDRRVNIRVRQAVRAERWECRRRCDCPDVLDFWNSAGQEDWVDRTVRFWWSIPTVKDQSNPNYPTFESPLEPQPDPWPGEPTPAFPTPVVPPSELDDRTPLERWEDRQDIEAAKDVGNPFGWAEPRSEATRTVPADGCGGRRP